MGALRFSERFKREEINGHNTCPTYMFRWILFESRWAKAYLHKFVGDDWTFDLHDHPKRFISIGLFGRYTEHTPGKRVPDWSTQSREYRAPWIRTFPAIHRHRITMRPGKVCWTLVIVGPPERDWGFWYYGDFIPFLRYVTDRHMANARKSC